MISPIRYCGLLIDLPPERVTDLLDNPDVTLARMDEIMYLRPQSVAAFPNPAASPTNRGAERRGGRAASR